MSDTPTQPTPSPAETLRERIVGEWAVKSYPLSQDHWIVVEVGRDGKSAVCDIYAWGEAGRATAERIAACRNACMGESVASLQARSKYVASDPRPANGDGMRDRSCRGCWWKEGDRCYVEPCEREADGRSKRMASERCQSYTGKRDMLSQVIPSDMLTITSESKSSALAAPPPAATTATSFQDRVQPWMLKCFGAEISANLLERNHRFLEEALELVQSTGCTKADALTLVDYVFGRPVGDRSQEVGGVMMTLAALCLAAGLDMHGCGETELARISTPEMTAKIAAKRAKKNDRFSPLPTSVATTAKGLVSVKPDGGSEFSTLQLSMPSGPVINFMYDDHETIQDAAEYLTKFIEANYVYRSAPAATTGKASHVQSICDDFQAARLHGQQKYGGSDPVTHDLRHKYTEWIGYIRDHLELANLSGARSMDQREHLVKAGGLLLSLIWCEDVNAGRVSADDEWVGPARTAPTTARERPVWIPFLSDRADGVKGHYAIGRRRADGVFEYWNLRSHQWASCSDDVLTLEQANEMLQAITFEARTAAKGGVGEAKTADITIPDLMQIKGYLDTIKAEAEEMPVDHGNQATIIEQADGALELVDEALSRPALSAASAAGEQGEARWIPVGEKLPEAPLGCWSDRVLISTDVGSRIHIDSFYHAESGDGYWRNHTNKYVHYWMPLPPALAPAPRADAEKQKEADRG